MGCLLVEAAEAEGAESDGDDSFRYKVELQISHSLT